VVLSTDTYIEGKALENNISYNEARDLFFGEARKQMMFELKRAIARSMNIVWDQTNLTPKVRKQKSSQIPSSYRKTVVWFDVSLEEAMIRNQQRPGKIIPGSVLKRMFHTFTPPTESEGFDQIIKGN
jgi:predicted kinase